MLCTQANITHLPLKTQPPTPSKRVNIKGIFGKSHYLNHIASNLNSGRCFVGLDLDCGPFLAIHTEGAIRANKLSELDVNRALGNLLTIQMRLGMFDGLRQPYGYLGPKDVCTPAHQQLALEAARQGIVLLQNRNRALPLSARQLRTVAVIGPNSDVTDTMIGNYAGTYVTFFISTSNMFNFNTM